MRGRHPLMLLPVVLVIALSSCAATPEPDWRVSQERADEFIATATSDATLGAGSWLVSAQDPSPSSDGDGVTLDYPSGVQVDGVHVACFGDGAIRVGYAVRTGSSWEGSDSLEVRCDGAANAVPSRGTLEHVNAIRFHAVLADGAGGVLAAVVSGAEG